MSGRKQKVEEIIKGISSALKWSKIAFVCGHMDWLKLKLSGQYLSAGSSKASDYHSLPRCFKESQLWRTCIQPLLLQL